MFKRLPLKENSWELALKEWIRLVRTMLSIGQRVVSAGDSEIAALDLSYETTSWEFLYKSSPLSQ